MESIKTIPETETGSTPTSASDSPLTEHTDHQLLAEFQKTGDSTAFAVLVQRHHAMVFSVARRMLGCSHSAEDVVQATFLVLAKDARKIRKRHSLVSWLYGVGYRISARTVRQQAKTTVSILEDRVMVAADPLEKLNARYEQETVFEELHRLPESLRAPLVLRYLNGNSNQQVARELNLSEAAVEGRLKRGRKQLRLRLAQKGVAFGFAVGVLGLVQRDAAALDLPHLVADTLATSLAGASASGSLIETGINQEILRMSEEELLKMATTKLISIAVMTSVVVCVVASGWAIAGNLPERGDGLGKNVVVDATSESDHDNPFGAVQSASVQQSPSESNSSAGSSSIPDSTLEQRQKNLGHYSVDALTENEIRILENLKKPATLEFFETRLEDVLVEISERFDIQILMELESLSDYNVDPETLVTFTVKDVRLDNALKLLFDKLHVATAMQNEVLMVMSKDKAYDAVETRIYSVNPDWRMSSLELATVILESVDPDSWAVNGGQGSISTLPNGLVIRASMESHGLINQLLAQFERLTMAGNR